MDNNTDPRVETAHNLKQVAPPALHDLPVWLLWKLEQLPGDKKPKKVPYRIDGKVRSGPQGTKHDRAGKGTLDQALAAYRRGDYHGIGIAPHAGAGVVAIDLDKCVQGDDLTPQAKELVERMDTYTEMSPSRTGVHLLALGDMASAKAMNRWGKDQNIEVFGNSGFVTFTGESFMASDAQQVNGMGDWLADVFAKPKPAEGTAAAASDPLDATDDARRIRDLKAALGHIGADDYDTWIKVGMAMKTGGDALREPWLAWSEKSPKFDADEAQAKWASFQPNGTNWKWVFDKAKEAGWSGESARARIEVPRKEGMELVGGLLVRASQVTPRNVEFLWNGKLARGKLTLLAGAPGTGKTTMALSFAATVSSAGKWPDGAPAPRGTVVLWTTEDDYDDTIIPRLIAAGANLDNILLLGVPGAPYFNPAEHMEQLMAALDELGDVSLLIFDPVVALVTGDSHKATEVRRDLQPLVDLLKVRGIAGLGITHFAKGTQGRATLERVLGSGAWGQLARGALGTVGDFETGEFRMVVVKTTHGKPGGGFAYRIEKRSDLNDAGLWASTIVWGDALEGNADQLLAEMEGSTKLGRPSKQDPATMLIAELLKGGEPVPYADIVEAGARHDISESSLYRASKSMNIIKVKPKGRDSKGTWQMPPPC